MSHNNSLLTWKPISEPLERCKLKKWETLLGSLFLNSALKMFPGIITFQNSFFFFTSSFIEHIIPILLCKYACSPYEHNTGPFIIKQHLNSPKFPCVFTTRIAVLEPLLSALIAAVLHVPGLHLGSSPEQRFFSL